MVLPAVIVAQGVALAVLAGLDGSPAWQGARVLAVIAATGLGVWFARQAALAARGGTALALGVVGTVAGAGVASAQLRAGPGAAAASPRWEPAR